MPPPRSSSLPRPSTGKPINNWELAIQNARSNLSKTPSPAAEAGPSAGKPSWAARKSALSHVPGAAMEKFLSEVKTIKLRKVPKAETKRESTTSAPRGRLNFSLRKKASQSSLAAATGVEQPIDEWANTTFTFKAPSPVSALLAKKQQDRPPTVTFGRTEIGRAHV